MEYAAVVSIDGDDVLEIVWPTANGQVHCVCANQSVCAGSWPFVLPFSPLVAHATEPAVIDVAGTGCAWVRLRVRDERRVH
jgi:hypothetical protein